MSQAENYLVELSHGILIENINSFGDSSEEFDYQLQEYELFF